MLDVRRRAAPVISSALRRIGRGGPPPKTLVNPRLHRPDYAGRHDGRTFMVLGTGPSLAEYREPLERVIERHDCVVMGPNNVAAVIRPDYHAFTNRKGLGTYGGTIDPGRSSALIGAYLLDRSVRAVYDGPYERLMYVNDHSAPFAIDDGIILASCRTSTILLIGVAVVMGASQVLVAGTDGYERLAEGGSNLYGYEGDRYLEDQHDMGVDYFREIDHYQARFLDEIAAWMVDRDMPPPTIVTPTVYSAHAGRIDDYL